VVRIDAHQHFWALGRGDYGWLTPALAPIYRDFAPADLAPLLHTRGIGRTILVQAAPTFAETLYMLELAARATFVAGVVGWVDFDAPDAAQTVAKVAADHPLLVGLRPMLHDIADDDWLLRPHLAAVFDAMVQHGLVFDALARPQHLTRVRKICERHPKLVVVIDHIAKPLIRDRKLEPWRADMAALGRCPNTFCKLSGIATEATPEWTIDEIRPYVDHALEVFGPHRLLWGSDWPVIELAGGYSRWWDATDALLASLDEAARDAILGGTAARVYLSRRGRS
jgi:L-fucono-1,5-lactonase